MLRTLFILLSFLLMTCRSEPFQIVDATSEAWAGGVKGSGRGVNYRVKLIVNRSSRVLQFDSLWVGERAYNVQASRPFPFQVDDGFKRKDTVIIYASLHQESDSDGELMPLPQTPRPPIKYDGDALLSYWLKGKRHFKVLKTVRELPRVDYP